MPSATTSGKAKKGDVALFYYSGHGSQEQAPEEFWKLEPDHLDETLVLFDSRSPGSWDLADKEIAKLIGDVAAKGPHVAVILDCCHSGSGTREIETVVRRAPTDLRRRPIESFLVSVAEAEAASASRSVKAKGSSRYAPPEGRHVLFAACRDDEEAKEYVGDGKHHGAFSFFLGDRPQERGGGADLPRPLRADVGRCLQRGAEASRPSSRPPRTRTSTPPSSTAPSSPRRRLSPRVIVKGTGP